MGRLFIAELKKLRSLNIWWLVIAGGILPVIISYLTLYNKEKADWLEFTHMSLLSFNVQSLLTFAAFAAYMWAREYEENTMELLLCYPRPRFSLILVKLLILLLVITLTTVIFFCSTLIAGRGMLNSGIAQELLWKLVKTLLHTGILHFLLTPVYLCIAMVTKTAISGLIFGIANMCICLSLSHTGLVQYLPQGIPYVLGDKILGINSLEADNNLWVYYCIAIGTFMVTVIITKVLSDRLKE